VKHPLAQERKSGLAIHLPLDELELCRVSFDHAVIDPPGETSSHRNFVFLDPRSKGLDIGLRCLMCDWYFEGDQLLD